ncbi:MAG TPA: glycosyltransferase [Stellaceae bacterium]
MCGITIGPISKRGCVRARWRRCTTISATTAAGCGSNFLPRYREAYAIHCLNTTQAAILAGHGVGHTPIVPHGVDRGVFPMPARPRQWPGGRLRRGSFSRWYSGSVKGGWAFDALLAQLDLRRVSFVFVGEGRRRDVWAARAKGLAAEHWERLPHPRLAEVYAAIDALLILSRFEGGPASLPEALGSGIPVLCTPVGICRDQVCDGGNGVLLTGRARTDGERIMPLLDGDGRKLALLNGNAFASAAEIPAWEQVMAQWHALYAEAAAAPA